MLQYKIEKYFHPATESWINRMEVAPPYNRLSELMFIDNAASAQHLVQGILDIIEGGEPKGIGFEVSALEIGPELTTLFYMQGRDEPWAKVELPSLDLLALVLDWAKFLEEQQEA